MPYIVFIFCEDYGAYGVKGYANCFGQTNQIFYNGANQFNVYDTQGTGLTNYSISNTTLSWCTSGAASGQMNKTNTVYKWIAIGL